MNNLRNSAGPVTGPETRSESRPPGGGTQGLEVGNTLSVGRGLQDRSIYRIYFFFLKTTGKVLITQSWLTLCDPMDCNW